MSYQEFSQIEEAFLTPFTVISIDMGCWARPVLKWINGHLMKLGCVPESQIPEAERKRFNGL